MLFKEPYSILAEAANMDLKANTEGAMLEEDITTAINSFDEASHDIIISAEMVPVLRVDESYVVEMDTLYSFMKSNNVKSIAEALNMIAESNNLSEKEVGLLIESTEYFTALVEKAEAKCEKDGDKIAKNSRLAKVKKAIEVPAKLKKDGFPVVKKKSASAKDEGCCGSKEEGCKK